MKHTSIWLTVFALLALTWTACGTASSKGMKDAETQTEQPKTAPATLTHSEIVIKVLTEGVAGRNADIINTFVREDYIQHSPTAKTGRAGALDFITNGPKLAFDIHRVLSDGDLVATHATLTFPDGTTRIAFDVFRIEGGQLAEHWGAVQAEVPASKTVSGNSMVDGPTEVMDHDKTEANRALATGFVDAILTKGQFDRLTEFVSTETYIQHNPAVGNGLDGLGAFVAALQEQKLAFGYTRSPLIVAQGNFVLVGSEGFFGPADTKPFAVFYDLFRIENGKIVEHWDVIPSPTPDPNNLPHDNGLF